MGVMSYSVGNICNRYANDTDIKCIYKPFNNLLDYIISILPIENIVLIEGKESKSHLNNIKYINQINATLYQYNAEFGNHNITNNQPYNFGMNKVIPIIMPKPLFIKNEDLYIMNQSSNNVYKILFSKYCEASWKFANRTSYIKYGIPDIFSCTKNDYADRSDKLLVFNLDKKNTQALESILSQNNINYHIITEMREGIVSMMNNYRLCLEMTEQNVINCICASACGCKTLMPKTPMLDYEYRDVPGLFLFNTIEHMIEQIKLMLEQKNIPEAINTTDIYSFKTFSDHIIDIIKLANKEIVQ